jgi:hypothetical protein
MSIFVWNWKSDRRFLSVQFSSKEQIWSCLHPSFFCLLSIYLSVYFWDSVLLCSPGWPQTWSSYFLLPSVRTVDMHTTTPSMFPSFFKPSCHRLFCSVDKIPTPYRGHWKLFTISPQIITAYLLQLSAMQWTWQLHSTFSWFVAWHRHSVGPTFSSLFGRHLAIFQT